MAGGRGEDTDQVSIQKKFFILTKRKQITVLLQQSSLLPT
jgi:hypothetical protein